MKRALLLTLILVSLGLVSCTLIIEIRKPTPTPRAVTTYYVGKSGSNSNSCATATSSTAGNRKLTIDAGIGCLASGDTLVIGAGVYDESIGPYPYANQIPNGTGPGGEAGEAAWPGATTIRAETPCSGTSCTTILRPSTGANCFGNVAVVWPGDQVPATYIIFQGFEADGNAVCPTIGRYGSQYANPIAVHHIRAKNVYWHNAQQSSSGAGLIGVGGRVDLGQAVPTHIEVLDSVLSDMPATSNPLSGGSYCLYWSASGTIRRNNFKNCGNYGGTKNGGGVLTHSGAGGYVVDISNNDVDGFGFWGIAAELTQDAKVYNNTVRNGGCSSAESAAMGGFDCSGIVSNSPGVNTIIANNTVYNVQSAGIGSGISIRDPTHSTNTTVQNNIIFGGNNDTVTGNDGGTISHNRCASGCMTSQNPLFVNAAGGNFHLQTGSPMIGIGIQRNPPTTDKDGNARPNGPYSLGAYEGAAIAFVPNFPVATDFPSVACCLDTYTRANGAIGANYVTTSGSPFTVASNQAAADPNWGRMTYTGATFTGPGHEAYVTMPTLGPAEGSSLLVFAATDTTDNNQYRLWLERAAGVNATLQVGRVDNVGHWTDVTSVVDLGADVGAGQSYGVRVTSAKVLTIYWQYNDGKWYRIATTTDSNLPSGTVRVGIAGTGPMTLDNLGGGACCVEAAPGPANIGRFGTLFPKQ